MTGIAQLPCSLTALVAYLNAVIHLCALAFTALPPAGEGTSDEQSEDEVSQHDEACTICHKADDMDMLLCDGCPKAFHLSCLGLASIPPGDWFCAVCNDEA